MPKSDYLPINHCLRTSRMRRIVDTYGKLHLQHVSEKTGAGQKSERFAKWRRNRQQPASDTNFKINTIAIPYAGCAFLVFHSVRVNAAYFFCSFSKKASYAEKYVRLQFICEQLPINKSAVLCCIFSTWLFFALCCWLISNECLSVCKYHQSSEPRQKKVMCRVDRCSVLVDT